MSRTNMGGETEFFLLGRYFYNLLFTKQKTKFQKDKVPCPRQPHGRCRRQGSTKAFLWAPVCWWTAFNYAIPLPAPPKSHPTFIPPPVLAQHLMWCIPWTDTMSWFIVSACLCPHWIPSFPGAGVLLACHLHLLPH